MKKRHIRWDRLILVIVLFLIACILLYKGLLFIIGSFNQEVIYEQKPDSLSCYSCAIGNRVDSTSSSDGLINLGEFKLTGYCNCEQCCGQWAGGPCANGEMPEAEWTIAVDPDVIPINSIVVINGHYYKACDTGSAINENRIDIYCDTHQECYSDYCNGYADVYLVKE